MANDETRGKAIATLRKRARMWWTVSVIFMTLGIVAGILEILGVLRDAGVVLTVLGVGIGLYSAFAAATQDSLAVLREDIAPLGDKIDTIGVVLERMERTMSGGFASLERVLIERLPERG